MSIMLILIPILALGLLGVAFATLLGFSNRAFQVHLDPKIEQVLGALPGSNCGACGFAGCLGLAEAIAAGKAEANRLRGRRQRRRPRRWPTSSACP